MYSERKCVGVDEWKKRRRKKHFVEHLWGLKFKVLLYVPSVWFVLFFIGYLILLTFSIFFDFEGGWRGITLERAGLQLICFRFGFVLQLGHTPSLMILKYT